MVNSNFAPPLLHVPSIPATVTSGGNRSSTSDDAFIIQPLLSVITKS